MSGSLTFNSVSSYSILNSLTSFIRHCCSCHQWRSRTESLPGCLPTCLLSARKFLSGLHPTYHLGMKKMIISHALGKPLQESRVHAQPQQAGEGDVQGKGTGAMALSGSSIWLWWYRANSRASTLWLSPRLSQPRISLGLLPLQHKVWKGNSRFLSYFKLQDIH